MLAIAVILILAMFAVMYFDSTRYIIPNRLTAMLLLLYPVAFFLTDAAIDWKADLLGFAISFAVGFVVFSLRVMGGGDVKLIIVLGLWVGLDRLAMFGFNFAVFGGILSIALLVLRVFLRKKENLPRIFRRREPVPYGIAIACAFLLMLFTGNVPVVGDVLNLFARHAG